MKRIIDDYLKSKPWEVLDFGIKFSEFDMKPKKLRVKWTQATEAILDTSFGADASSLLVDNAVKLPKC